MSSGFTATYPSWLVQPAILLNVINNQFASLKEVAAAVQVPDYTIFIAHLKQALYWRRRLAASATNSTVIFSFLGVGGLLLPNVLEVCQALKSICNTTSIVEVYRAPNSPFIGISFSNNTEATKFQALCLSFNSSLVVHVTASSLLTHPFKLLWLPPMFPDTRVHHFLAKHSDHHKFTRDLIATDTNVLTPSNSVSGILQLSPNQDINSLPHLIPLPAPHLGSALLVISGRASLCLKCCSLGHIRRHCTTSKCTTCHRYHLSSISCATHQATLDPSLHDPWVLEATSNTSQPSEISVISESPKECDHTRMSSPPASPSSHVIVITSPVTTTPAIMSPNTSASSTPPASLSLPQTEIPTPSHLSADSLMDHPFLTPSVATINFSQSVINSPITAISHTTKITSHDRSSSYPKLQTSVPSKYAVSSKKARMASKREKKAASSKRFQTTSSSSSSAKSNCSSNNIFAVLDDELDSKPSSFTTITDFTSTSSVPDHLDLIVASSHSITTVSSNTPLEMPRSNPSTSITHKKAKYDSNTTISTKSAPHPSFDPIITSPASCWGDRMEVEPEAMVASISHLHSSSSLIASATTPIISDTIATSCSILPTPSSLQVSTSSVLQALPVAPQSDPQDLLSTDILPDPHSTDIDNS